MAKKIRTTIDFTKKIITDEYEPFIDDEGNETQYVSYSFQDDVDMLAMLIPKTFTHESFRRLESEYMQQTIDEGAWWTLENYLLYANCTIEDVIKRASKGEIEIEQSDIGELLLRDNPKWGVK